MSLNSAIRGIQIRDEVAGAGLTKDGSGNLQVNVDDSSLEIDTDVVQVKASGITNDMLAGSIVDAKLDSDYIQTSEVDGATIEFGTSLNIKALGVGTGQLANEAVEVGKIAINNAEVDGYVLAWSDSGYMEWVVQANPTEDYITEAEILFEDESANCDDVEVAFTLASAPVANSVAVYLNGLLQQEGSGKDYTIASTTVTFALAPATGDILLIHYIAT